MKQPPNFVGTDFFEGKELMNTDLKLLNLRETNGQRSKELAGDLAKSNEIELICATLNNSLILNKT
ncbi:hypothetical protein TW81_17040 [Vibrio galatheae]|uniref:Uncharacterized protein n=1 Tax=Vibrio galatheae TaxID=579748 RepID=A0A0F4NEZ6_9VIBR|nr:hypothetical protein TW81_17040 [Vibrio galatheae]